MAGGVTLEIIIIFGLILLNGYLAMSEIAVVSARKVRLQARADEGDPGAKAALRLSETPSRFLSTVQIGISLVGVLTGAFGGATVARALEELLQEFGLAQSSSQAIGVAVVVLLITYFTLVIGELAPKQIALLYPERIAGMVARPMSFLSRLTTPAVTVLTASTRLVLRLLGIRPSDEPEITEEEVKLMIDRGAELGVFEPIEDTIVDQVFRLSDRTVSSLITPRPEIVWLDLEELPETLPEKILNCPYSHFPVARGDLDHLEGFVRATDLLGQCLKDEPIDLSSIIEDPLLIPEHIPAFTLLDRFRETGSEIAFALNEYGGIEGLVTLRDILEALVGDLPTPEQKGDPDIVRREDGSWLLDGMLPISDFRDLFDLDELPGEDARYFQTLGGFVLTTLGEVPSSGDHFYYGNMRIEVVDMDGKRIDKVLVVPDDLPEEDDRRLENIQPPD